MGSSVLREPAIPYGKIQLSEKLLQCIWYEQWFRQGQFITLDGKVVEVLSPGWWNLEAGPDFKDAQIRFIPKGEIVSGDIELHLYSSDWFRHNHHQDGRYGKVILHGIMKNDLDKYWVTGIDGQRISQLILYEHVARDLGLLKQAVDVGIYPSISRAGIGKCWAKVKATPTYELGRLFDLAGDQRILNKSSRFLKELGEKSPEQTIYEAIAQALGYKDKKIEFRELARRLPMKFFKKLLAKFPSSQEKLSVLQTVFLGVAGILPEAICSQWDSETVDYLKTVNKLWKSLSEQYVFEKMRAEQWKTVSTRPANFPSRRMVALTRIILNCGREGIFQTFMKIFKEPQINPQKMFENFSKIFSVHTEKDYWNWHYTFGSRKLNKPVRLIGKDRVSIILINAVIPVLLAVARKNRDNKLKKSLYEFYAAYPALPGETVVKFVSHRMFGQDKSDIINSARRQQGLHQIFNDFCLKNMSCQNCGFLRLLGK